MGEHVYNPRYRDGGRREEGEQPYEDAREQYAENEARIEERASSPGGDEPGLTDEEQRQLEEQAAEDRFDEIGREVKDERGAGEGEGHGH